MAYENQTKAAILQRMLDNSPTDIDKRQGSATYDLLSPAAIEMTSLYTSLDTMLTLVFADTAEDTYLDRRVGEFGVVRKESVKAKGVVNFSGPNGTLIVKGTEVYTSALVNPVSFLTDEDVTIAGGTASVAATAKVGGANGNVSAGEIKLVKGDLTGIVQVNNAATFNGGADRESDEDLLERYLGQVRNPATSGNANQYIVWARSIAGISDAHVYPVWNGAGTVRVVLLSSDARAPLQAKVDEVEAYIESVAPVGAEVTVQAAAEVNINVSATITIAGGYVLADVITAITNNIRDYLAKLAFVDTTVRIAQIGNVILDTAGVVDYTNLKLNNGTVNISVATDAVAVLGTVTLS